MPRNIVKHPETGQPAEEVVTKSYVALDLTQLEAEVLDNEAALNDLLAQRRAQFEETLNNDPEVQAARSAVEDSKSDLATSQGLSNPEPAATEDGAVEQDASTEAVGDAPASDSGSEGDNEAGVVEVPVVVEESIDEY